MKIRTVSLCLIRRGQEILVEETIDPMVNKTFYRPIGGTVEYGENSKDAVIREVREEINAEISDPKLIFVIENIFKYLDQVGHEVDFIYEAELADKTLYNKAILDGTEGVVKYKAVWKPIHEFTSNPTEKLVPDGLLELLLQKNEQETNVIQHKAVEV